MRNVLFRWGPRVETKDLHAYFICIRILVFGLGLCSGRLRAIVKGWLTLSDAEIVTFGGHSIFHHSSIHPSLKLYDVTFLPCKSKPLDVTCQDIIVMDVFPTLWCKLHYTWTAGEIRHYMMSSSISSPNPRKIFLVFSVEETASWRKWVPLKIFDSWYPGANSLNTETSSEISVNHHIAEVAMLVGEVHLSWLTPYTFGAMDG